MKRLFLIFAIVFVLVFASSCNEKGGTIVLNGVKIETEKNIYALESGDHIVLCKNKEMQEKMNIKEFAISVHVEEAGVIYIKTLRLCTKDKMEAEAVGKKETALFSEFRFFHSKGSAWVEDDKPKY